MTKSIHRIFIVTTISLIISSSCNDTDTNSHTTTPDTPAVTNNVKNIGISVLKTYPHDTSSFTQGLVIYKGQLYEGTGGSEYAPEGGGSELLKVNLNTGKAEKKLPLDKKYFGEGITILNDTIYQLTWREKVVFVYDMNFKKIKEYPINTEGWGITTDGKELIVSDGSSNLYFYDPSNFQLLRTQSVTQNNTDFVDSINELEFMDGFVYANQWGKPYIFKIDPASGQAVGRIDVTQIWERIKQIDPDADVPNGIAYDHDSKKIYITGKKWPELYEVQLGN